MSSQDLYGDYKNPLVNQHENKSELIAIAAAKGAGLALVAGGLIAMSGARYSKTYQTLTRPMKAFLLGSGKQRLTTIRRHTTHLPVEHH